MLELKLEKENLFLKVLEAILDLVDVAHVDCSSKGLKLQVVDKEIVALIVLLFGPKNWQHYHCDEDFSMGIAIGDLVKAVRCANEGDTITIKVGDKNCNTINLSFESSEEITVAHDLRLVDANNPRFDVPDWKDLASKYQAAIKMPSAEFMRICKYLSIIGGDVFISATEEGMHLLAWGIVGYMHINYMKSGEPTATVVTVGSPVSMTLDLKYMNCFAKASTLFKEVEIFLSTTQPLMVQCEIEHMCYIRCFLSPNGETEIEEEEIKIGKRKRDDKDEGIAKEKEGSKEIKGSAEEEGIQKESKDRIE
ncbi:hypothetical protein PR202_gb06081 [Eleusine coracana subsp. coracana]|uniref:DNA sliding clamp PCNA n=1 Tax=Eleusine coracana subsp. coracana TaxID=191504 RepID=A0AAV5E9J7_ELECO|nr:hypothetical protein QOZ80_2BG0153480 [Eleusine coracana subsp. coracana]GJN18871.1 hypothetical protein PR202_gb06081 [Eleusine coracana subsp. coracana]